MGRGRLVVLLEVGVTNGRDRERKQLQHQFSSYQLVTGNAPHHLLQLFLYYSQRN